MLDEDVQGWIPVRTNLSSEPGVNSVALVSNGFGTHSTGDSIVCDQVFGVVWCTLLLYHSKVVEIIFH